MKIDFDQIRELLAVFSQTDITELSIEAGDQKVTVKKAPANPAAAPAPLHIEVPNLATAVGNPVNPAPPAPAPAQVAPEKSSAATDSESKNGLVPIASPMVGTFYRSPSPSAPSFVDVGDRVAVGQTVCIIEAMKLMNDLPSEVSGRIVKVCVDSGTTVEYGQPLFMVDPRG